MCSRVPEIGGFLETCGIDDFSRVAFIGKAIDGTPLSEFGAVPKLED